MFALWLGILKRFCSRRKEHSHRKTGANTNLCFYKKRLQFPTKENINLSSVYIDNEEIETVIKVLIKRRLLYNKRLYLVLTVSRINKNWESFNRKFYCYHLWCYERTKWLQGGNTVEQINTSKNSCGLTFFSFCAQWETFYFTLSMTSR